MLIKDLELSIRAGNVLSRAGITTVAQLTDWMAWRRLEKSKSCGTKTLTEIAQILGEVAAKAIVEHDGQTPDAKSIKYDKMAAIVKGDDC